MWLPLRRLWVDRFNGALWPSGKPPQDAESPHLSVWRVSLFPPVMAAVDIFRSHHMCTATEQMCCTLDLGGGETDAFHGCNLPLCSVFVSEQAYWSPPCRLIRVNLVGWARQLLRWKLSLRLRDGRWRGAIYVGPPCVHWTIIIIIFFLHRVPLDSQIRRTLHFYSCSPSRVWCFDAAVGNRNKAYTHCIALA